MLVEHRWSEAKAGKRAPETAEFYAKKSGELLRLFGEDFRLAHLDAPAVDAYVRARREEGTSDHTIHKELTTLRAALRLALRARLWSGSLYEVLPETFSAGYKPRERALTPAELSSFLGQLTAAKAAAVAFMVATSANWRECTRARREDIDPQSGWIYLRGTKRQTRDRRFVVAHPALLSLLRYAAGCASPPSPTRSSRPRWATPTRACWSGSTASSRRKSSVGDCSCTPAQPFRTASLMHQLEPKSTEFPDTLDTLEQLTPRNWCPGAESNHRHGDFQSPALPTELPGLAGAGLYAAQGPGGQGLRPGRDGPARRDFGLL
jgi:hypothetical protein